MNQGKTNNSINFYYAGDITEPTVVFIHGNSLNAKTFSHQLERLDLPRVAIDLPGHGETDRFDNYEEIYSLPGYINALRNVIDYLNLKKYILVGHSLGGHIAIEASEELSGTKGLMIFGTPAIGMPPEMDKMFLPNPLMNQLFAKEINAQDAKLLAQELIYNNTELIPELTKSILNTDGNARTNLGASIGQGHFKNERDILNSGDFLTAIIHGQEETLVNLNYLKSLEIKNLWKNNVITLNDCGHTPQLEKPQELNELIINFYSSLFA